jgi:salicylate hydroxylase
VLTQSFAADIAAPDRALQRYEARRIPCTARLQEVSHGQARINHLPDGAEQPARAEAFADNDPLVAHGWIYAYDPDEE